MVKIKVKCDYCSGIILRNYKDYLFKRNSSPIKKDCCKDCKGIKQKETTMFLYGVDCTQKISSVKKKTLKTLEINYGTGIENPFRSEVVKEKIVQTNLLKFGVKNYVQTDEFKGKSRKTSIKKYGVPFYTQTGEFKQRQEQTCINKYGVNNPMKNSKIKRKLLKRIYEVGKAPCSKQQKYIHNLIEGKLNYPVGTCLLDIAFPEEKIYVEYDGSGHELSVKFGSETKEKFDDRNKKRWYFLQRKNWKEIRIISTKDILPSNEKILEIISYAKSHFSSGHSWITFDIDNYLIETSSNTHYFDYGQLRRIS
ncbi:DUF7487 domain-containing protein [Brevibacillus laterosporus]|uniref:DUF7487 domain-containing protein n=1 Tax=Brevibacillus laterosporus TaxID=1465 RepID=UPI004032C442